MSATEIIAQFEKLPATGQTEWFATPAGKVIGGQSSEPKPGLGKKLSLDEACEVVFRENRELFVRLAK